MCKDIELKKTNNGTSVCELDLAVNRIDKTTDFFRIIVWKQSAEYLCKYAHKGNRVAVSGRLQSRSYDGKNGKVYVVEVVAEQVEICESRVDNQICNQESNNVDNPNSNMPVYDDYESNTPKLNGEDIDNLPFY